MNQTDLVANSNSDGVSFEVSTDAEASFIDVGVMENGYSWTDNYSTTDREWGNAANPNKVAKNQKITLAPSELAVWKGVNIAALSAGMRTSAVTAGTEVADAEQVIASGDWEYNVGYLLTGQNGDGTKPTVSVEGSVNTTLVEDTDYIIGEMAGGWGLFVIDSTTVTTEAQSMTVTSTYTPAAGVTVYSGSSSTELEPYVVRFTHYTNIAKTTWDFRHTIFRVSPDAGGMTFNKLGSKSDTDYDLWTVALTGEIDSSRDDGKQLDSQYYADSIYG